MFPTQYNKNAGALFEKVSKLCLLLIDVSDSMEILDNISVILRMKKYNTDTSLSFHLVQAFGTAEGLIDLITEENNCVFFNFTKFLRSIEDK